MSIIHTKWLDPKSVIKKLENWRDKGTVLNLIISAGGGINTDVTIQSFEPRGIIASGPSSPTQDNSGSVTMLPSALPAIVAVTDEPLPDVVIPALGFVICQSRVTLTVQIGRAHV